MAPSNETAKRFVDALNAHDEARLNSLNAPDATLSAPGEVEVKGREGCTAFAMAWLNAFPDARITVTHQVASGDWTVQEFIFEGTHAAPLTSPQGEIPATGRTLVGHGVQLLRCEDDLLYDTRLYWDQVEVLTQLGLMPPPGTS